MKVFHVTKSDHGQILHRKPQIPSDRSKFEDDITPRICVSPSLNGCLSSTDGHCNYDELYVYETETENLYQPLQNQVCDAFLTGELWLTEPTQFGKVAHIIIRGNIGFPINNMENNNYVFEYIDMSNK